VGDRDDEIGTLASHFRDELGGRLDDALRVHLAVEPALVPRQDGGGSEADDADLDGHLDGAAVWRRCAESLRDDLVGLEQRRLGLRAVDVGQHLRKIRAGARRGTVGDAVDIEGAAGHLIQVRQAVVELVVAYAAAIELDLVHDLVHRERVGAGYRLDQRLVV